MTRALIFTALAAPVAGASTFFISLASYVLLAVMGSVLR